MSRQENLARAKRPPVIEASELVAMLDDEDLVIADCRHSLADPGQGRQEFERSHLPGAVFVGVDTVLAAKSDGRSGRHPLPLAEVFLKDLAALGVRMESFLVAYDGGECLFAARLWWMTEQMGLRCAVLNGGYRHWCGQGYAVTTRPSSQSATVKQEANPLKVPPSGFEGILRVADVQAMTVSERNVLVDARDPERYAGRAEFIDPVAGHIPGARNRPATENFDDAGLLKDPAVLRAELTKLPTEPVHYCGSGISACVNMLALARAGRSCGRLYAGSWSHWCADSKRPVATIPALRPCGLERSG